MSKWHKCPNVLVDKLMGEILSPSAACVVLTIWRLTEGVRERHQASIPTETFMRVTGTKRKNTAYQYVNEAVQSGLVTVKKEQGKVNVYSINKDCLLWYGNEVVAESVPTTESATSVDKCNMVVAENDTGSAQSSGGKRHTYKDIEIKDSIKEIKKADVKKESTERELTINSLFEKWKELSGQKIKPLAKRLSNINARLEDGFTVDEIITAMTFVATDKWHVDNGHNTIELAIRSTDQLEKKLIKANSSNQLTVNNQVNNYGQQQAQQNQSSSDKYIEQLKREYLQGDGSEQTIKDVN